MKSIFRLKVTVSVFCFLLLGLICYGQDYSIMDNLPIPANTEETESGLGQAYGVDMKMFSSQLSISGLKNFYQGRLSGSGWKLMDTAGMFSSSALGQMNAPAGTAEIAQNSLVFQKGKSLLVVAFYPSYGGSQSTVYSITEKQMP